LEKRIEIMRYKAEIIIFLAGFAFLANFAVAAESSHSSEKFEVTVIDLGLISYNEAPRTWTIDVPVNFDKVEAGQYGKEGVINQYGGWNAYLEINGNLAWKFVRHDSQLGGIFYDYIKREEVQEKTGNDRYLDVTSMVKPGENTVTFYHYTEGDAGIKIRIWRKVQYCS
jgi:hypothetical protein